MTEEMRFICIGGLGGATHQNLYLTKNKKNTFINISLKTIIILLVFFVSLDFNT